MGTFKLVDSRFRIVQFPDGRKHYLIPEPKCELCCEPLPIGSIQNRCDNCTPSGKIDGTTIERVIASTLYITRSAPKEYPHNAEILALKNTGANAEHFAPILAVLARDALTIIPPNTMVCPIPKRGFNEPGHFRLARFIAQSLDIPYFDLISFREATVRQKSVSYPERLRNLDGKMQVRQSTDGWTVLLVDDILTTGSTLHEGARALKERGAMRVIGLVAGRAISPQYLFNAGGLQNE